METMQATDNTVNLAVTGGSIKYCSYSRVRTTYYHNYTIASFYGQRLLYTLQLPRCENLLTYKARSSNNVYLFPRQSSRKRCRNINFSILIHLKNALEPARMVTMIMGYNDYSYPPGIDTQHRHVKQQCHPVITGIKQNRRRIIDLYQRRESPASF